MTESPRQGSKIQMSSKFQLVIAVSKRSKQIASEAKTKGLSPNQVALVKSRSVKSTTLALEELKAGKVRFAMNKGLSHETSIKEQSDDTEEEETPGFYEDVFESEKIEISESKC
ncbi:MAG: DNA-directed RNA polymerase subunit omega [bacterium]